MRNPGTPPPGVDDTQACIYPYVPACEISYARTASSGLSAHQAQPTGQPCSIMPLWQSCSPLS